MKYSFKYSPGDKLIGSGFEGNEIEYIVISHNAQFYEIQDSHFNAQQIDSDPLILKE
jgi:hypothetical protein